MRDLFELSLAARQTRVKHSIFASAPYFIVAAALTNAAKHARASSAQIVAVVDGAVLRLAVRDDGVGGPRTDGSAGLLGLRDRAAAPNGELRIESPTGDGTMIAATTQIPTSKAA